VSRGGPAIRIYLDHNATTPVREEVADAMGQALRADWGNPSSVHAEGARAREQVEVARARVASLLAAEPRDVIFTSCATEANNTLLRRVAPALDRGRFVLSTTVEHPSVEAPLVCLERDGWRVTRIEVDADGRLDLHAFEAACQERPAVATAIWANNETGVVTPIPEVAACAHAAGALVHVDATQAVGKLPIDLARLPIDALSLSAHKLGGPKGIGALVLRGAPDFDPLLGGGGQEAGRRGGTENVPGIVGLGVACALAAAELPQRRECHGALRDSLWRGIESKIPRVRRNGAPEAVLPNTLNVEFDALAGEVLVQALDLEGIAISAGAACASGSIEPSRVLVAMGRSPEQARGALRFSVGHGTGEGDIERLLSLLPDLVSRVRAAEVA
jgi:cysteine desulfurase